MKLILYIIVAGVLLAGIFFVTAIGDRKNFRDFFHRRHDSQYLDDDGNHTYYDRSIIKKKNFRRLNPKVKNLRSFRRLFFGSEEEDVAGS